jgi:Family of unknown function (DUF6350)
MKRSTVALLAALEAVVVAAIGLGIAVVPLTVLWATKYNLAVSWLVFWRAAADTWLLGHGVNLTVSLDQTTALNVGLPGAAVPFQLTIAALGFAFLAVMLGVRTGRRAAETDYRTTGVVFSIVAYGVISTLVTLSAGTSLVQPSTWQGIVLPMFVFGLGVVVGALAGGGWAEPEPEPEPGSGAEPGATAGRSVQDIIRGLPPAIRSGAAAALRGGTVASAGVIAASAVVLALLIVVNFGTMVGLYERLQAGAVGGAALTIAQLAFLPNAVIWVSSWLIGPGFAIGTGSSVSPVGTALGPIPTVPLFGALPHGEFAFGFVGLLVPVLAGFAAALLISYRRRRSGVEAPGIGPALLIALGIGIVAGIELGLLAWWSSGAIGPGRLHNVGPDPWMVGLFAAAEIAVAAAIGMIAGGRTRQ